MEILNPNSVMYFDLETEGLDPFDCAIRAAGFVDVHTGEVNIYTALTPARERDIVGMLTGLLMTNSAWGGWNITEFDLAFLAIRAYHYDLELPIHPVDEEPYIGKYGRARVVVPNRRIHDIAYDLRDRADDLGVKWSLHDLARTTGWTPSSSLMGGDMVEAPISDVVAHLTDDLNAMHSLVAEYGIPDD